MASRLAGRPAASRRSPGRPTSSAPPQPRPANRSRCRTALVDEDATRARRTRAVRSVGARRPGRCSWSSSSFPSSRSSPPAPAADRRRRWSAAGQSLTGGVFTPINGWLISGEHGRRAADPRVPGLCYTPPYGARHGRARVIHRCTACAAVAPKWSGQCGSCDEWNTLVEDIERASDRACRPVCGLAPASAVQPHHRRQHRRPPGPCPPASASSTACSVVGFVPGSVTLLGGEPGIGKSTLLLQMLAQRAGARSLYVSAEESAQQVKLRAERLGAESPDLWLLAETAMPHIARGDRRGRNPMLVVDRLDPDRRRSRPAVDARLGRAGARVRPPPRAGGEAPRASPIVLVGHVTKDGALAGPRVLEHVVDTVLVVRGRASPRAAPAAGGEAPLRSDQRARAVRDGRRRACRRARPERSVPVRPPPGHGRLGRGADARGPAPAPRRDAGAGRDVVAAAAAPLGAGVRSRPAVPPARRARAAGRHLGRRPRRVRVGRSAVSD